MERGEGGMNEGEREGEEGEEGRERGRSMQRVTEEEGGRNDEECSFEHTANTIGGRLHATARGVLPYISVHCDKIFILPFHSVRDKFSCTPD